MKNVSNLIFSLEKDRQIIIDDFIKSFSQREVINFTDMEVLKNAFQNELKDYLTTITKSEKEDIRSYTGFEFANINAILRNDWNYEKNGLYTEEKRMYYDNFAKRIENAIRKFPPTGFDFVVYRGINLQFFYKCGVKSLEDLNRLVGCFLMDSGFTSTSLMEEDCFFGHNSFWHNGYKIEMEIKIDGNYSDGIFLGSDDITYSLNQKEFLINSGSVINVTDVVINDQDKTAVVMAILLPDYILNRSLDDIVHISL
ncbi:MAG: ADP-ribosyltransferase [Bacilli bacterium]